MSPRKESPRPLRLVDTELTPAWDVVFSIRGVDVPVRSPMEVEADGDDGMLASMVRAIFPGAVKRKLRRDCLAIVAPGFAGLIRSLTPAEMLMLRDRYMGVQAAWFAQASERALAMASESFAPQNATHAIHGPVTSPSSAHRSPFDRVANAMVSIAPGRPLPGWMDGGRVFGRSRGEGGNG